MFASLLSIGHSYGVTRCGVVAAIDRTLLRSERDVPSLLSIGHSYGVTRCAVIAAIDRTLLRSDEMRGRRCYR